MKEIGRKSKTASGRHIPPEIKNEKGVYLLLSLLVVTFLTYLPALSGQFVNWDDPLYVTDSPWIRLSIENIKSLFCSLSGYANLPLTRLSLSLNHALSGFDPGSYHLTNILLHLLNTTLVFLLVSRVMKALKNEKGTEAALVTAAFFGLHPLHVESVAWVAERKDVLYATFFLASLISYLTYLERKKAGYIFLTFLLFLFSVLAKGPAITLPLILLAVDWLLGRKARAGEWLLEKGPFFAVSLIFGLWTILITKSFQGIDPEFLHLTVRYSFWDRLVFSGYAFTHYLVKIVAPLRLSVIYPYPGFADGVVPLFYWAYLLPVFGAGGLVVYFAGRTRQAAFAILFFLINISVTFQLILAITPSIMNDRYTYLASTGIFFLFALIYRAALKRWGSWKRGVQLFLLVCLAFLAVVSFQRTKVWKDSLSLWNDVLSKYGRVSIARINRGEAKAGVGDFEGAMHDFERALAIDPDSSLAWSNQGAARIKMGDFKGAMPDLDQAVRITPEYADAYLNRGTARGSMGDYTGALEDFSKAISLKPLSVKALTNRGFIRIILGNPNGALEDCNRALELAPDYGKALWGRGSARIRMGNRSEGCADLKNAWNSGIESAKLEFKEYCQN